MSLKPGMQGGSDADDEEQNVHCDGQPDAHADAARDAAAVESAPAEGGAASVCCAAFAIFCCHAWRAKLLVGCAQHIVPQEAMLQFGCHPIRGRHCRVMSRNIRQCARLLALQHTDLVQRSPLCTRTAGVASPRCSAGWISALISASAVYLL